MRHISSIAKLFLLYIWTNMRLFPLRPLHHNDCCCIPYLPSDTVPHKIQWTALMKHHVFYRSIRVTEYRIMCTVFHFQPDKKSQVPNKHNLVSQPKRPKWLAVIISEIWSVTRRHTSEEEEEAVTLFHFAFVSRQWAATQQHQWICADKSNCLFKSTRRWPTSLLDTRAPTGT